MSAILPAEQVQSSRNLIISQRTLHQLEGSHRLTKLFTVMYVLYGMIKSRLHEPELTVRWLWVVQKGQTTQEALR